MKLGNTRIGYVKYLSRMVIGSRCGKSIITSEFCILWRFGLCRIGWVSILTRVCGNSHKTKDLFHWRQTFCIGIPRCRGRPYDVSYYANALKWNANICKKYEFVTNVLTDVSYKHFCRKYPMCSWKVTKITNLKK